MASISSGIHDNYRRGTVGEFLKDRIKPNAELPKEKMEIKFFFGCGPLFYDRILYIQH